MIKKLFISFLLIFFTLQASATHSAGGELVYEWVADSTYRFYLKFYRDCAGIEPQDTVFMCYFNSCDSKNGNVPMTKISILPNGMANGGQVNPGCPGVLTTCTSTSSTVLPGYREWWYSALVTVPSRCDYWTFYVSINARNPMDNLSGSIFDNLYLEATMNNADAQKFSSPYFTVKPVPYVCVNEPHIYSSGPVDPDGDSLSFEFVIPRTTAGINGSGFSQKTRSCSPVYNAYNCTYSAPFSVANPFATSGTFTFDPATSLMRFTPSAVSVNTITVQVNKWRNKRKLGSVIRDIQLRVINCTTSPVALDIIQASVQGAQYVNGRIEACAGAPFSFCFNLSTTASGARLIASDNHVTAVPGSGVSYSNQGTTSVMGCFSWLPPLTETGLRFLAVTVKDSTCNAPGVMVPQTFTIPIFIRPVAHDFVRRTICLGDTVLLNCNGDIQIVWSVLPGGGPVSDLSCTNCKHPVAKPGTSTTYIATYNTSNTCASGDTVQVKVYDNAVDVAPSGQVILCAPDSVRLSALARGPLPFSNLACGAAPAPPAGTVQDTVFIAPDPGLLQNGNNPGSTPFNGNYATARHQYLLRASDLFASGLRSGTLTGLSVPLLPRSGSPAVFDHFSISLGCTDQDLDPAGSFSSGTIPVYTSPGVLTIPASLGALQFGFDIPYNWDTTQHLLVDICYSNAVTTTPVFTPHYTTVYDATLYSYHITGNICAGDPSLTGGILLKQLPRFRFEYTPAIEKDFSYDWYSTGNSLFLPDTNIPAPTAWVPRTSKIYVRSFGREGCVMTDSLDVYVAAHSYVISRDTFICRGNTVKLYAGPGYRYAWYEDEFNAPATLSCTDCPDPAARPDSDIIYTVIITDSVQCADTLSVKIKVNPVPDVRIQNNDTTIGYGGRVQLTAGGAAYYLWTPGTGLNALGEATPVASPEEDIVYVVRGELDGCYASDTVRIFVDRRGKIFIPSAFSPDGDGLNDEFRVANISFQQIKEFRVFNRWGGEVFYTTDPKKGWNGAWKGIPQEIGVYFYLIRLAYPDGEEETHRGDVTLIR